MSQKAASETPGRRGICDLVVFRSVIATRSQMSSIPRPVASDRLLGSTADPSAETSGRHIP